MKNSTAFLGKLIGIYLLLFGVAMLARKAAMLNEIVSLMNDPPLVLVLSMIVLAAGVAVVLTHNVWSGGVFPVVVTVIGWLTLLKGIALLFMSPEQSTMILSSIHYQDQFYYYAIAPLVLGGYLTWMGFKGCCSKKN